MNKNTKKNNNTEGVTVKVTKGGAMYVETVDLFSQKKVQDLILKLAKLDIMNR